MAILAYSRHGDRLWRVTVNRTIAFTGMTGTAAKAAVANAMMEATLGIAESEAKFFQTATLA
jgi:hypothetical protein